MIAIRFDGPPSHESGRFIEVERDGASISFGEWKQDGNDWLLELTEVAQLEAENEKLLGFWNAVCDIMFECWELDGGSFQDMGEKFGLLVMEIYDPEGKHKDMNVMGIEPGDECWFNIYALEAGGRG